MGSAGSERRLLLVHAHPDDESIFTGATMAKYAAEGAHVTLVTCTQGERGGIRRTHPAAQQGSLPSGEDRLAKIAEIRAGELKAACAELGIADHQYLGGPGRWRDSGDTGCDDPHAFCNAELDEVAGELASLIRRARPQVIVTYDANGFYGHPDHIQAHRAAWHAYQQMCDPSHTKFYAATIPRSVLASAINAARQSKHVSFISYRIRNADDGGWSPARDELAAAFARAPGLVNKIWLRGAGAIRGGVCLWQDKAAYDAFLNSDLARAFSAHPDITDLTMHGYAIDETPTRTTRGLGPDPAHRFTQFGMPDDQVSTEIRAESFLATKLAALKAHATQVAVDGTFFQAARLARMRALGTEYYTLLSSPDAATTTSRGRSHDLFSERDT